jgi:hypothetical protein
MLVSSDISLERKLALWAGALLLVSLANHIPDLRDPGRFERTVKTSDLMRLYVTGAIAARGRWDGLYDAQVHAEVARQAVDPTLEMSGLVPNYGPSAAAMLAPLSRLSILQAWGVLALVTIGAFTSAVWRTALDDRRLSPYLPTILLLAFASPALAATLRYGQLAGVTTSLFLFAVILHRRQWNVFSGICVGLCFFKPQFVVPALAIFLLNREGRLLAGVALGVAVHLMVGLGAAGMTPTAEWFDLLLRLARDPRQVQGFATDAHSFHGFWRLAGLTPPWLGLATGSCGAAVVAAAAYHWRVSRAVDRWGTTTLATVLASPHLLTYDLLLLTIPLLLAAPTWFSDRLSLRSRLLLGTAVYLSPFVSPLVASMVSLQYSTVAAAILFGQMLVEQRALSGTR